MKTFVWIIACLFILLGFYSCDEVHQQQEITMSDEASSEEPIEHQGGTQYKEIQRNRNGFGQVSESSEEYFKRVNKAVALIEENYVIIESKFVYWEGLPVSFIIAYKEKHRKE